mmetsp:Transcript_28291/g.71009  ORF Transcript_28291/g.71009 Transcript_28291/m.71009 type:complete len:206 (+) Transcript_28291:1266-1883(+)
MREQAFPAAGGRRRWRHKAERVLLLLLLLRGRGLQLETGRLGGRRLILVEQRHLAKVDQFELPAPGREQTVLEAHAPIGQPLGVNVLECSAQLPEEREGLVLVQRPTPPEVLAEVAAAQILQEEQLVVGGLRGGQQVHHVRMSHQFERLRLHPCPADDGCGCGGARRRGEVRRGSRVQIHMPRTHLDGHHFVGALVGGQTHLDQL